MIKLVPSKQVQEYLDEIHFTFTDFEKATLIWNNHLTTKEEKLIALKEMMNSTKDEMLKNKSMSDWIMNKKYMLILWMMQMMNMYIVLKIV